MLGSEDYPWKHLKDGHLYQCCALRSEEVDRLSSWRKIKSDSRYWHRIVSGVMGA